MPKKVHETGGIKPRRCRGADDDYRVCLYALGQRGLIRDGMTTDAFMNEMRGDYDHDPGFRSRKRKPKRTGG
jgi:hypothetical protein